jgi:hypothetical protein
MLRPLSILLGESHHLTHVNHDFRERQPVMLLLHNSRFDGETQRIDEREKVFVVPGDEITWQPDNRNWGVFHERFGGGKASPVAP